MQLNTCAANKLMGRIGRTLGAVFTILFVAWSFAACGNDEKKERDEAPEIASQDPITALADCKRESLEFQREIAKFLQISYFRGTKVESTVQQFRAQEQNLMRQLATMETAARQGKNIATKIALFKSGAEARHQALERLVALWHKHSGLHLEAFKKSNELGENLRHLVEAKIPSNSEQQHAQQIALQFVDGRSMLENELLNALRGAALEDQLLKIGDARMKHLLKEGRPTFLRVQRARAELLNLQNTKANIEKYMAIGDQVARKLEAEEASNMAKKNGEFRQRWKALSAQRPKIINKLLDSSIEAGQERRAVVDKISQLSRDVHAAIAGPAKKLGLLKHD